MKNITIKSALSALFLFLSVATFSCKDHDHSHDPEPMNTATITITSPAENSVVISNETVTITGTITGEHSLHGYTIYIRRKGDSEELFKKNFHDHSTTLNINQEWTVGTFTTPTDLELEVITSLDHDGNTATKKVSFQAKP